MEDLVEATTQDVCNKIRSCSISPVTVDEKAAKSYGIRKSVVIEGTSILEVERVAAEVKTIWTPTGNIHSEGEKSAAALAPVPKFELTFPCYNSADILFYIRWQVQKFGLSYR